MIRTRSSFHSLHLGFYRSSLPYIIFDQTAPIKLIRQSCQHGNVEKTFTFTSRWRITDNGNNLCVSLKKGRRVTWPFG